MPAAGTTRIGVVWRLPEVMRQFDVDLSEVLADAGLSADLFDDRDNRIAYRDLGHLLASCEQRTRCDHISLLVVQRSRLDDLGLAGRAALCGETAGEGLRALVRHSNLVSSASQLCLFTAEPYARLVFAIHEPEMLETRSLQAGALAMAHNFLHQLCGPEWSPVAVTFAMHRPANLLPFQQFFRAPLRFDSEESALIFASHWLDRPRRPIDPHFRQQVDADLLAQQTSLMLNLAATVRSLMRMQLLVADCTMDSVAAALGMHRRTLDRHLSRQGLRYRDLLGSVTIDVARELLRDTNLPVQRIAESLHFATAANFATAFRQRTGLTPSQYRRSVRGPARSPS